MSTQVRERPARVEVGGIRVRKMPFGLNAGEIVAAVVGVVLVVWVVVYYFTTLRPLQDQLRALETEFDRQQKNMIVSAQPKGNEKTPQEAAKDTLDSLESFKTHLKPFTSGRIELIKQINALAKKDNVTLTSGIDMGAGAAEADKKGEKPDSSQRTKTDEMFNAFPSVSFHFTVFGPYTNVRTFISDLELEKQFVVVKSVSLTNQEARTNSRRSRGGEGGMSGIMLTIEMSAYFQT